jgi:hypothetical protein
METDNRHHTRAKVIWPVSINAPTGIVDGTTENLSLSGAFIRLSKQLSYSDEMPLVLKAKGRSYPVLPKSFGQTRAKFLTKKNP